MAQLMLLWDWYLASYSIHTLQLSFAIRYSFLGRAVLCLQRDLFRILHEEEIGSFLLF